MPDYADLIFAINSNVATITLNRPDRLNAISGPILEPLSTALRDADHNRDVRVIIITGAGRGFCAGLDLKDLVAGTGIGSNGADGLANARFDLANSPPIVLHTTDKPVICAINGPATAVQRLGEDAPDAEEPRYLVTDDDAAGCWTSDQLRVEGSRPIGDHATERFRLRRLFKQPELFDV